MAQHVIEQRDEKLRIETVRSAEHPLFLKSLDLYRISFPEHEQRESLSQNRILRENEYHFGVVQREDLFVGLALFWETAHFIYVEHLCICPELRGNGYGEAVLRLLGQAGKPIILEIDPPMDEISIRRLGFYRRCGFYKNSFTHIHPPYHRGNHGHDLVIMSYPNVCSDTLYPSSFLGQKAWQRP